MEKTILKHIVNMIVILAGNCILAFGICAFITPSGIIIGGSSGVGILIKKLTGIPISYVVYAMNISMFILGYKILGKTFALGTLVSTIFFPTFLAVFERIPALQTITQDMLLASIYAGIMTGAGLGLVIRVGACTGGCDIPPLIVSKYTGISSTTLINSLDCIILALQIPFSNIEQILYGILVVIITALVMDQMIMLGESKIQVIVISPKWNEIRDILFNEIDRGCTLLNIKTGYKQEDMYAVLAVVSKRELHRFTNAILNIDETAFIISNQTHNVKGRGFTLPNIDL